MRSLRGAQAFNGPVMNNILMVPRHIYTDGVFNTAIEQCETYGHDSRYRCGSY